MLLLLSRITVRIRARESIQNWCASGHVPIRNAGERRIAPVKFVGQVSVM